MARRPQAPAPGPGLFEPLAPRPLADRLRPTSLDEVVGQDHLLADQAPIAQMVAAGRIASMAAAWAAIAVS